MHDRCGSCKWYVPEPGQGGGMCFIAPPVPLAIKSEQPGAGVQVIPLRPPVREDDGCAQHQVGILGAGPIVS